MRQIEPHRLAWHALGVLIGLSAFVVPPDGLALLVAPWLLGIWVIALMGSGLLGITAPFRRRPLDVVVAERVALWIQTITLSWIIISSVYLRGLADLVALVVYLIWIAANVARDRQIASALTKSPRPPGK